MPGPDDQPNAAPVATVKDPVCGMTVNPLTSAHTTTHDGRPYVFCCAGCRTKFEADPGKYLNKVETPPPPPAPAGTIFTCPMDPEIRQEGPGACPICGMALEPELVTAEAGPNPELIDMTRRFWIALALTTPVFVLEMGGHLTGIMALMGRTSALIQMALATPVVLWAGRPFFQRGWTSIRTGKLNMFTLIAMGVGVSWTYSMVAVLAAPSAPC